MTRIIVLRRAMAMVIAVLILTTGFLIHPMFNRNTALGDPPFSNNVEVSNDPGTFSQKNPSIAVAANGTMYAVWEDDRLGDWDLFIANSTDGGITWSNPDIRINTTTDNQINPSLAVYANETLYAAWQDDRNGDPADIYFANSTDGGMTWSNPNVRINSDVVGSWQFVPTIAVDSIGNVYVAWEDFRNGDYDIYFAMSSDGGATWTDPNVRISTDITNASQRNPTIAANPNGNIYVAWEDDRNAGTSWDIYFANSTDSGVTWSDPNIRVNSDSGSDLQRNPSIAVNDTGIVFLTWEDYRNLSTFGADIYFAKSDNEGALWTDPNILVNSDASPFHQDYPTIVTGADKVYIAWEDGRNGDADIFYSESSDGGLTWRDPNLRVNDDTGSLDQTRPAISVTSNGTACVVWEDYRSGDNHDIFFASLEPPPPPPTVDRIIISLTSDASSGWIGDRLYFLSDFETFYVCGWNDTNSEFVELVDSDWFSDDTGVGTVNFGPATSILFNAVGTGTCKVRATNSTYGLNWTGILTVIDYEIDRMFISLSPDGSSGWIGDKTYAKYAIDTYYAIGWNDTYNAFVEQVDATWISSDPGIGDVTTPGPSSTFTAYDTGTCQVSAINATHGSNDTGVLTVMSLEIDRIVISEVWDGATGWLGYQPYPKYDTDTFWACGWNETYNEFVEQVEADWSSDDLSVGSVNFGPAFSTQFNALNEGICIVTANNATYGSNDTGILTVNPLAIDSIIISRSSDASSGWVTDGTYTKYEIDTFYACGWNETHSEFVDLVQVDWESDDESIGNVTTPGTSTAFTAVGVGTCRVSAIHATYGSNETGILTVNPLDIDGIIISLTLDGSSGWLGGRTYTKYDTETLYACGWNDTYDEFVNLVDCTWSSDDSDVGNVTQQGTSATFTALGMGTCKITATNATYGLNETGVISVGSLEIDRILISLSPDGSSGWADDESIVLGGTATFYACGWNDTHDECVIPIECDWVSNDTNVGVLSPQVGNSTTFSAVGAGTCKVSATNTTFGSNETGVLLVPGQAIDRIFISKSPDGSSGWIGDDYYALSDVDTYYACAWNDTLNMFIGLVESTWSSDNTGVGDVTPQGPSTTFTVTGAGTCVITATNTTYGSNQTGVLTVSAFSVDRVIISVSPDFSTGWIGDDDYKKYDALTLYACGWNDTAGEFVKLVEVDWSSDAPAIGDVTLSGTSTTFTAQDIGTCTITATSVTYGSNKTGILTITPPFIDQIIISRSDDGASGWAGNGIYIVDAADIFYATGWNQTYLEFISLVYVEWESSDTSIGTVTTSGHWTNFTAQWVSVDSTCTITATYGSISNTSGSLVVLTPTADEIMIRDTVGDAGNVITTMTYNGGETDSFHAAAYNDTVGFLFNVEASWTSSDNLIGQVTNLGAYTTFTAQILSITGTCTVTATYGSVSNLTGLLTVNAAGDITPPAAPSQPTLDVKGSDKIEIAWPANTESDLGHYVVQRATSSDGSWVNMSNVPAGTEFFEDSDVEPDTVYFYRIVAVDNASNPSDPSPVVSAKTESEEEFPMTLILLIVVVIVIVVILLLLLVKKKSKVEDIPSEETASPDVSEEVENPVEEEIQ